MHIIIAWLMTIIMVMSIIFNPGKKCTKVEKDVKV